MSATLTRTMRLSASFANVVDLEAAMPFWTNVVGLTVKQHTEGSWAMFEDEKSKQLLVVVQSKDEKPGVVINLESSQAEWDSAVAELEAAGCTFTKNVKEDNGFRWAEIVDANGVGILMHADPA